MLNLLFTLLLSWAAASAAECSHATDQILSEMTTQVLDAKLMMAQGQTDISPRAEVARFCREVWHWNHAYGDQHVDAGTSAMIICNRWTEVAVLSDDIFNAMARLIKTLEDVGTHAEPNSVQVDLNEAKTLAVHLLESDMDDELDELMAGLIANAERQCTAGVMCDIYADKARQYTRQHNFYRAFVRIGRMLGL